MFSFFFELAISLVFIVFVTFLVSSLFESFDVVELLIDVFKLGFLLFTVIFSLSLLSSDDMRSFNKILFLLFTVLVSVYFSFTIFIDL